MTLMREYPAIRHVARLQPPFWILTFSRISSSLLLLTLSLFLIVIIINVVIVIIKVFGFIIIVNIITRNHQCQGCNKYLTFDECQPLLFHRPNVQNVWKYCSEDWISYKTADSRRFIERTFLDKVEHIHQKLWTDFTFSFFPNRTWIPITYFSIVFIFLFWHDDGYHMKEKSSEENKEYCEHYDVILTALIFVSNNAMELPSSWWKREVHCKSPLFLLYLVWTSTTVGNVNKCRVEMQNLEVRQRCSQAPLKKLRVDIKVEEQTPL